MYDVDNCEEECYYYPGKRSCKGHMKFKDYDGDILYSILPNTSTLVGTSCKYFTRVNKNLLDEEYLVPDVVIDLDDPEK